MGNSCIFIGASFRSRIMVSRWRSHRQQNFTDKMKMTTGKTAIAVNLIRIHGWFAFD